MKKIILFSLIIGLAFNCSNNDDRTSKTLNIAADFDITETSANYDNVLEQIVMRIDVAGIAGNTVPTPVGQLDGAPVLEYVFPTSLDAANVCFGDADGIVALALTSHPDFDDTLL